MDLIIFLTLILVSTVFLITAGISKDRTNLFPAGAILLLVSLFLISGSGLEIPTGIEYEYEEINEENEKVSSTINYEIVEFPAGDFDFSNMLGLLLLAISLYFMGIAGAKWKFISNFR